MFCGKSFAIAVPQKIFHQHNHRFQRSTQIAFWKTQHPFLHLPESAAAVYLIINNMYNFWMGL